MRGRAVQSIVHALKTHLRSLICSVVPLLVCTYRHLIVNTAIHLLLLLLLLLLLILLCIC
jgi:hypothetical protein